MRMIIGLLGLAGLTILTATPLVAEPCTNFEGTWTSAGGGDTPGAYQFDSLLPDRLFDGSFDEGSQVEIRQNGCSSISFRNTDLTKEYEYEIGVNYRYTAPFNAHAAWKFTFASGHLHFLNNFEQRSGSIDDSYLDTWDFSLNEKGWLVISVKDRIGENVASWNLIKGR